MAALPNQSKQIQTKKETTSFAKTYPFWSKETLIATFDDIFSFIYHVHFIDI